jgi:hypothetical protein
MVWLFQRDASGREEFVAPLLEETPTKRTSSQKEEQEREK